MAEAERLGHYDLCYGCGQANLLGLQLELEPAGPDRISGRFFVKQDHQGPPGHAHGGVLAAALDEAMSVLIHTRGTLALTARLEVDLKAPAPVGEFVELEAELESDEPRKLLVRAVASGPGGPVARARGTFVKRDNPG